MNECYLSEKRILYIVIYLIFSLQDNNMKLNYPSIITSYESKPTSNCNKWYKYNGQQGKYHYVI